MDSVLDVVRKEAEGTDCLQGSLFTPSAIAGSMIVDLVDVDQVSKSRTRWVVVLELVWERF